MQNLISAERVSAEVSQALVETLRVDSAKIRPESSIVRDLGAESLDFLDVNYRLETAFGIRMARHFFLEHMEEIFGEGSAVDDNGRLTERALALVRERYPEAEVGEPGASLDMDEVAGLITVRALTTTVMSILDTLPERCTCGASAWRSADGMRIVCGSCGEPASFTNGDELIRQWLLAPPAAADDVPSRQPG
jgi:acyl carrier protein